MLEDFNHAEQNFHWRKFSKVSDTVILYKRFNKELTSENFARQITILIGGWQKFSHISSLLNLVHKNTVYCY